MSKGKSGCLKKALLICGAFFLLLMGGMLYAQQTYEKGWRRIIVFNTSSQTLQVGVEEENDEWWMAETLAPGEYRGLSVRPGRVRSLVVDESGKVVHRGEQVVELAPSDGVVDTKSELVYIGTESEGTLALVDAAYLYTGMNKATRRGPTLLQAVPAGEILVTKNRSANILLPIDELPESQRRITEVLALRYSPAPANQPEAVLKGAMQKLHAELPEED